MAGVTDRATGLARATAVIVVGTAVGKVLGFARDATLAGVFGAGPQLDAYLVAQSLPNVAVGLTSSAVVTTALPTLAGLVARNEADRARRVFGSLLVLVSVVLVAISAALAVAARPLVSVLAPGFGPDQLDLAVDLTRILLSATVFVSATNLLVALLHAHRRFLWASLVAVPFNVALIVAALGFGGEHGATSLAVGFVVGSVLRVVLLVPDARRIGLAKRWRLARGDERVRGILALAPPLLAVHLMSNVNSIADRWVGSQEAPGTISALNLAYRLLQLPHTLLAMALVQALYPAFGAAAGDDDQEYARLLSRGLGVLAVILLPIGAAVLVLREPLVELAYGRGSFDTEDVRLTSLAMAGYAVGIVALGMRELVNRGLFAQGDTRTPTVIAGVAMVVNVVGDLTLGRALGIVGLAISTTLAFVLALVLSLIAVERRHHILRSGTFAATLAKATGAAAVGGVVALAAAEAVPASLDDGSLVGLTAQLAVPAAVGGLAYVVVLRVLRTSEATEAATVLRRLLRRS